ncbi:signal peptide peptidase SppA [Hwanghaeella grinnelliae]|uniref:Signal peptide peptidase SppA n=1 Tax=Hwanghaeella grinnelliae TaxID=2500179 RepID=A0A437QI53_9PROT|nr:signal peptide peptidase SppA [Hwanghaeella grinnelliae]RVU34227.1 signal peptide peptidase SppA [Hwanghaeella grinnelliae]
MRAIGRFFMWLLAGIGFLTMASVVAGIVFLVTQSPQQATVPERAVLWLDLNQPVVEKPVQTLFGKTDGLTMIDMVAALDRARTDDRIKGVVAVMGGAPISMAQAQELADAIRAFRASGKFTLAYAEDLGSVWNGTVDYLLAGAFEELWLQPSGGVGVAGLALETPFFRGAFEKIGVSPQFEQRHEYKGGIDPFVETGMTPAIRESYHRLLGSWTDQLRAAYLEDGRLAKSSSIEVLFNGGPYLAKEALALGLVDKLAYWDEVEAFLDDRLGPESDSVSPAQYNLAVAAEMSLPPDAPRIALVYGEGAIMPDQPGGNALFGARGFSPYDVADALADAREDDNIDAVVFRVDSPGGAYGPSDAVWREVARLREAGKPVIAVMGSVAASGGYFVSMQADRVLALPGTITGSIGVYSGKFATMGLWEKLGVRWERVRVGQNAAIWSGISEFSQSERERFRAGVDFVYEDFTQKVAAARGLSAGSLDAAARGRIWTGRDAMKVGLIDGFGGLLEAIAQAKEMAGFDRSVEAEIVILPHEPTPVERLEEIVEGGDPFAQVSALFSAPDLVGVLGFRGLNTFGLPPIPVDGVSAHMPAFRLAR